MDIIGAGGGPRAGAVVVHGLNNRVDTMDALIGTLVGAGIVCARIDLHGTDAAVDAPRRGSDPNGIVADWVARVEQGRRALAERHPGLPVHAVGHSLGALVVLEASVARSGPDRLASAFLLAPPLALTPVGGLIRLLTPAARAGLSIPSLAPRHVRARRHTPIAEYSALLALRTTLDTRSDLDRLAVTCVVEPRDELVDADGVRAWVARRRLGWRVEEIRDRAPTRWSRRHLMVAPADLGDAAWYQVTTTMIGSMASGDPPSMVR